jgi:transcriptional regulator with XRE-family HTH domain
MNHLDLGQRVKELRNRKGISQEVLAEESGLSLRTIQRIENNETIPRGDTLKRLSIALGTSPDELIDWKIKEDRNYLSLMNLSTLGFLFFPLLGIIIPLTMWTFKKDKVKGVNELGKSILNFQISWCLSLFLCYIFIFGKIFILRGSMSSIFIVYIPIINLYTYNVVIIIFNTLRINSNKTFQYKPALQLLK